MLMMILMHLIVDSSVADKKLSAFSLQISSIAEKCGINAGGIQVSLFCCVMYCLQEKIDSVCFVFSAFLTFLVAVLWMVFCGERFTE